MARWVADVITRLASHSRQCTLDARCALRPSPLFSFPQGLPIPATVGSLHFGPTINELPPASWRCRVTSTNVTLAPLLTLSPKNGAGGWFSQSWERCPSPSSVLGRSVGPHCSFAATPLRSSQNLQKEKGKEQNKDSPPLLHHTVPPSGLAAVPFLPLTLGLAGALPFLTTAPLISALLPLPALVALDPAAAQAAYGACILSFLGAPHWGLAMAEHPQGNKAGYRLSSSLSRASVSSLRYTWGVVPSLLAWSALLLPLEQRFLVLIPSFLLVLGVDLGTVRLGLAPSWYPPLRIVLTTVAVLSMSYTALSLSLHEAAAESDRDKEATPC